MVDIHCHILPEVDDGPKSWDVAEAMCRIAATDGIEHMVATPHSNDRYFYDREYLSSLLLELQRRIGDRPKLSLGCDFHLSFENMQSALEEAYSAGGPAAGAAVDRTRLHRAGDWLDLYRRVGRAGAADCRVADERESGALPGDRLA